MKKQPLFFLLLLMAVFFSPRPVICAVSPPPRHLSVVYCRDIEPFEYTAPDGKAQGMIIDFWKLWEKKTGIRVDFVAASWNETLALVRDGKVDAHAGLFYSLERDQYLDYGAVLSKTNTNVFVHKSITLPEDIRQLAAYRIGVIKKDFVEGYLKKRLPPEAIVGYPDYRALMADLRQGRLKVFAADTPTGLFHLSKHDLLTDFYFKRGTPLYTSKWYVATGEGRSDLLKVINAGMAMISKEERKQIARHWISGTPRDLANALVIAVADNYPPLSTVGADGKLHGYLIDLWRKWSAVTGRKIRFRPSSWRETLEAVKNGEADLHSGLYRSTQRSSWLDFSEPLLPIDSALYQKIDARAPLSPQEHDTRRIGVVNASYQAKHLSQRYPTLQLVSYPDVDALTVALLRDEVDAIFCEKPTMESVMHRFGVQGVIRGGKTLLTKNSRVGVEKGNTLLLKLVNKGLQAISPDEYRTIRKRWFNEQNPIWPWLLYGSQAAAIIFLLLALLVFFRNRFLGREIDKRKKVEAELSEARSRAEAANRAKSRFLANMSHEIRTPMHAITGMTRLTLETSLDKQQHDYLTTVQSAAEGLLALLNDILDFSKIEAGQLEMATNSIDLEEVLRTSMLVLRQKARDKGIEFLHWLDYDLGQFRVIGDELRLKQVLINLLSNAVKFTEQGHVLLTARVENTTPDTVSVLFRIEDSGIGISNEEQKRIFHEFAQADASIARQYGGTGLGLAITKKLIALMGSELSLNSQPGTGSTFFFSLKLPRDPGLPTTAGSPQLEGNGPVLLLHPLPLYRELLGGHLRSCGLKVITVRDAHEALSILHRSQKEQDRPGLFIMGNNTADPDLDHICTEIEHNMPEMRLILLGDIQEINPSRLCAKHPVSACLVHPFGSRRFHQVLAEVMRGKQCVDCHNDAIYGNNTETSPTAPMRILVAEDNPANQTVARLLLEQDGHRIFPATDGRQALEVLGREEIDLVLMDVQMPGMDGLRATRILRCCESGDALAEDIDQSLLEKLQTRLAGGHLPVVAVTANAMSEDRKQCLAAGMDDYLMKPFIPEDITAVLRKFAPAGPQGLSERALANLEKTYNLQPEQLQELFQVSVTSLEESLQEAGEALRETDLSRLQSAAHKMKGTLLGMGLTAEAGLAREIEQNIRVEAQMEYQRLFDRLKRNVEPLLTESNSNRQET